LAKGSKTLIYSKRFTLLTARGRKQECGKSVLGTTEFQGSEMKRPADAQHPRISVRFQARRRSGGSENVQKSRFFGGGVRVTRFRLSSGGCGALSIIISPVVHSQPQFLRPLKLFMSTESSRARLRPQFSLRGQDRKVY